MSDVSEMLIGVALVLITYVFYLSVIFAFLWAVWNWIVLPTVPYLVSLL